MTNMIPVNCDTTEIWMSIFGYEGIYEVSSKGKVRKLLPDGSTKNMTPSCVGATREYRAVTLTKDKVAKLHYIHRLVAEAFIGLPPQTNPDGTKMRTCPEINHIDGNCSNNVPSNLEWCDRYYNNSHRRPSKDWNYTKKTIATGRKRKGYIESIKEDIDKK